MSELEKAVLDINVNKMVAWTQACMAVPIRYGLGAKVAELSQQPDELHELDCSGFMRWLIYHATGLGTIMPDGSVNQHAWCEAQKFKHYGRELYSNCGLSDGHVRLCFINPAASPEGIGHVWLCYMGLTCECHGGKGCDMRAWNSSVLAEQITDVYVIA